MLLDFEIKSMKGERSKVRSLVRPLSAPCFQGFFYALPQFRCAFRYVFERELTQDWPKIGPLKRWQIEAVDT
jgi:hypothetical protein